MAKILKITLVDIPNERNVYIIFTKKKIFIGKAWGVNAYEQFNFNNGVDGCYFTLDKARPTGRNIVQHTIDTQTYYGYSSRTRVLNKSGFKQNALIHLRLVKSYVTDSDEANTALMEVLL